MCTRLHPDIIVATEVNNAIKHIALRRGVAGEDSVDESLLNELDYIYVSTNRCLERQKDYTQIGLCNVFIGYGDKEWTRDDYQSYFESQSQCFELVDDYSLLYKVRMDEYSKRKVLNCRLSIRELANFVSKKLLTQDVYNQRVLTVLGF